MEFNYLDDFICNITCEEFYNQEYEEAEDE